jgi:hypothetical protein
MWHYRDKDQTIWNAEGTLKIAEIRGWGQLQYQPNGADTQDANGRLLAAAPELLAALQEVVRISDRDHLAWVTAKIVMAKVAGQKPKTGIIPMSKLHPELWDDVIYKGSCPDSEEAMQRHVEAWNPETHPCKDSYLDSFDEQLTGVESWTGNAGGVVWVMDILDGVAYLKIESSPHLALAKNQAYDPNLAVPEIMRHGEILCYTVPHEWWL